MFNIEKNISKCPNHLTLATTCEYFHGQGLGKITWAFGKNAPKSLGYVTLATCEDSHGQGLGNTTWDFDNNAPKSLGYLTLAM
jgi:hypothetical protein